MKKFEITHYPVVGSSALDLEHTEYVVELPVLPGKRMRHARNRSIFYRLRDRIASRIMRTQSAQDLLYGSLQGKSFNKAKGWQTLAMGGSLFVIALICLYFG